MAFKKNFILKNPDDKPEKVSRKKRKERKAMYFINSIYFRTTW